MFLHDIMSVYISSNDRDDFEVVCTKLKKCEDDFALIEEKAHAEISLTVARHILEATRVHVMYKYDQEFESQLQNVTSLKNMNLIDEGTLEACKSIAWTKFDVMKSIDFIRKAVQFNPKCDLWHFILGRELRRKRRDNELRSSPSEEELNCFKEAYDISHNPFCGVFFALALGENKNYRNANIIYNNIYETGPREVDVLLRLALGFLHSKNFSKAKDCLDKVAITNSDHNLYLHYQGIYHMKLGQLGEAVPFLERAITDNHLGVEKDYLYCRAQVDESFDTTNYILGMIDKYRDFPVKDIQHLHLELAVNYAKNRNKDDVIKAMECFISAIRMDPRSRTLEIFRCCVNPQKSGNVYRLLMVDFLPRVYEHFSNDEDVTEVADTLKQLADENSRLMY